MASGFTPLAPERETPSTDEVIGAIADSANMLRRASIASPDRAGMLELHHEATSAEVLMGRMRDAKRKGLKVFGNDADTSAEKKLTLQRADQRRQAANLLIPPDYRPPVFGPLPVSAMYVGTTMVLDPTDPFAPT